MALTLEMIRKFRRRSQQIIYASVGLVPVGAHNWRLQKNDHVGAPRLGLSQRKQ